MANYKRGQITCSWYGGRFAIMKIKAYIIRIPEDASIEQANECAKSLKEHNVPYEFFDGIYKHNLDEVWRKENLQLYRKQSNNKKVAGVKGCFLSHYMLWKKCIERDTPIIIFEHDGLLIKPLPQVLFESEYDVLNLDYSSREVDNYWEHVEKNFGTEILSWVKPEKMGYSKFNTGSIDGIHGYIIKPSGAKKLINFAKEYGTLPADIHINSLVVDLKYTKTSYVKVNPKYWHVNDGNRPGSSQSFTVLDW